MPNPENLQPFKRNNGDEKDDRINRKGRTPCLKKSFEKILSEEKNGINATEAVLMALLKKATKGDVRAIEVLLKYGYGLPAQKIDMTSNGETITPTTVLFKIDQAQNIPEELKDDIEP